MSSSNSTHTDLSHFSVSRATGCALIVEIVSVPTSHLTERMPGQDLVPHAHRGHGLRNSSCLLLLLHCTPPVGERVCLATHDYQFPQVSGCGSKAA